MIDQHYTVSRSLMLQLDRGGFWTGSNSVSRTPQKVGDEALPILAAFARPTTLDAAHAILAEEWEIDRGELESLFGRLVELGFLTSTNGSAANGSSPKPSEASNLAKDGFAGALPHFFMIRDAIRVGAYRNAIERHCHGRSVLEIGCGSGILSLFAAKAGAESVIAIEESEIARLAERMFEKNGCSETIDLRLGNSRDIEIEEKVDVIVHEILGTDPLEENMLFYLDDARHRFLKPGGRVLPHRLEIACVGVEIVDPPALDREQALAETERFGAAYGLDFEPLAEALSELPDSRFPRPLSFPMGQPFPAPILTHEARIFDLDLEQPTGADLEQGRTIRLETRRDGRLGAVLLFFHAHLDERTVLSTSPYSPPTHWGWDVRPLSSEKEVKAGQAVELAVGTERRRGSERLTLDWP